MKKREKINQNILDMLSLLKTYISVLKHLSRQINSIEDLIDRRRIVNHLEIFYDFFKEVSWSYVLEAITKLNEINQIKSKSYLNQKLKKLQEKLKRLEG